MKMLPRLPLVLAMLAAPMSLAITSCRASSNASCDAAQLSAEQCAGLADFAQSDTLPPAKGNRFAESTAAVEFGFRAFFDPRFSNVTDLRCASCHQPERYFHDGKPVPTAGAARGVRNSPTVLTVARMDHIFVDGRADSLWSQALFAVENPGEMASTRLELAHAIKNGRLLSLYEAAFGAIPDLSSLPARGKPGDPAWDALSAEHKFIVNTIAANFGKGIEAYLRRIQTGRAPFDAFARGDSKAISASAARGFSVFLKSGCASCHSGAAFSDQGFHDMGIGNDAGLEAARPVRAANEFNASGQFFDAGVGEAKELPAPAASDARAFRTPTLRDVMRTAPYGHDGSVPSVPDLLKSHGPTRVSSSDEGALLDFLFSLTGTYPEKPYSDWPAI